MLGISKILGAFGGDLVKDIGDVVGKFVTTDKEREELSIESSKVILAHIETMEESLRAELAAKSSVLIAELQQGDKFTKRARPGVVWCGLAFIGFNHVIGPWIAAAAGATPPNIELPEQFWWAWGGIVSTWVIGRSAERRGIRNKAVDLITGGDPFGLNTPHLTQLK